MYHAGWPFVVRNLEVPDSRLGSSSLPVISGLALTKLNYWRSAQVLRRTQSATNWAANEYRAVVTVLGMWKLLLNPN